MCQKPLSPEWRHIPVVPAFECPRQEDYEFEVNGGYIIGSCLRKQTNKQSHKSPPVKGTEGMLECPGGVLASAVV